MRMTIPDTPGGVTDTGLWPALPFAEWRDTGNTLLRWTQIVGKTRLALAPMVNHWWQVPLYVSARGLTTSAMPYRGGQIEVEFDFTADELQLRTSDGTMRVIPLVAQSVADFYQAYMAMLRDAGIDVSIWPVPVEVEDATPFAEDEKHGTYDAAAVHRMWRALLHADRILHTFRGRFCGKASPVHFFWGGFDLATSRFSGRLAPPHPGGVPHVGDWVMREAYSHEVASAGFWPGNDLFPQAAFYAYAYPEPAHFAEQRVMPMAAYYDTTLREFILPYDAVRGSATPDAMVLDFLQSTYAAAADLAQWDRAALERSSTEP
ncbi:MAG TPA: DUF5996 family protein [Gemmatimonadaceae bacterium]|jgi:hypothetical protein|nr:DUF5996 family protein [Gemmatimonadaceae bacterium]